MLEQIETLISTPDAVWSKSNSRNWLATQSFLNMLLAWGRAKLGAIAPTLTASFDFEPPAEKLARELLLWRITGNDSTWPQSFGADYERIGRFERYRFLRILENSWILEPSPGIDALQAFFSEVGDQGSLHLFKKHVSTPAATSSSSIADPATTPAVAAGMELTSGEVAIDIDQAFSAWRFAALAVPSRNMVWSLGHVRIIDGLVYSLAQHH